MTIYENEIGIKIELVKWIMQSTKATELQLIINEFTSKKSPTRADIVSLTKTDLIAYEIKSNKDSLIRLKKQVQNLKENYNRVYVVVSDKHYKNAKKICQDEHIGLIKLSENSINKVLNGRKRLIKETALKRVFKQPKPGNSKISEEFYKIHVLNKYRNNIEVMNKIYRKKFDIEELDIKMLNPYFCKRQSKIESHQKNLEKLKNVMTSFQSIQSSSKLSSEKPV